MLAIVDPTDGGDQLRRAVVDLAAGRIRAVGLTSPNGVDALVGMAADVVGGRGSLATAFVACVGPGTARRWRDMADRDADLVAPVHTTAGLGSAFPAPQADGDRVLLPRADLASPVLPGLLEDAGWVVDDVEAYRTRLLTDLPDTVVADLATGRIDAVAAGSPSTVEALAGALGGRELASALVSIGPVTSGRARAHGMAVAAQADPHDLDGLVLAITTTLGKVDGGVVGRG